MASYTMTPVNTFPYTILVQVDNGSQRHMIGEQFQPHTNKLSTVFLPVVDATSVTQMNSNNVMQPAQLNTDSNSVSDNTEHSISNNTWSIKQEENSEMNIDTCTTSDKTNHLPNCDEDSKSMIEPILSAVVKSEPLSPKPCSSTHLDDTVDDKSLVLECEDVKFTEINYEKYGKSITHENQNSGNANQSNLCGDIKSEPQSSSNTMKSPKKELEAGNGQCEPPQLSNVQNDQKEKFSPGFVNAISSALSTSNRQVSSILTNALTTGDLSDSRVKAIKMKLTGSSVTADDFFDVICKHVDSHFPHLCHHYLHVQDPVHHSLTVGGVKCIRKKFLQITRLYCDNPSPGHSVDLVITPKGMSRFRIYGKTDSTKSIFNAQKQIVNLLALATMLKKFSSEFRRCCGLSRATYDKEFDKYLMYIPKNRVDYQSPFEEVHSARCLKWFSSRISTATTCAQCLIFFKGFRSIRKREQSKSLKEKKARLEACSKYPLSLLSREDRQLRVANKVKNKTVGRKRRKVVNDEKEKVVNDEKEKVVNNEKEEKVVNNEKEENVVNNEKEENVVNNDKEKKQTSTCESDEDEDILDDLIDSNLSLSEYRDLMMTSSETSIDL